jgi:hypothetical protein
MQGHWQQLCAEFAMPSDGRQWKGFQYGRYLFHVRVALGSLGELATHFELARRLEYFTDENADVEKHMERTAKLRHGLARSVWQKQIGVAAVGFAFLAGLAMGPLMNLLA